MEMLTLHFGEVACEIAPDRGALVTSLSVASKKLLFLDRSTLEDRKKSVRGGIPILFPFACALDQDTLVATGTRIRKHGFGRDKAWSVEERREGFARLSLLQDAETRDCYPFDYDLDLGVWLLPQGMHMELSMRNRGTRPLPVAPGFHPYFPCPAGSKSRVSGNVPGLAEGSLEDDREFDFGLLPPQDGRTLFSLPGLPSLRLSFSPEMRHIHFWSQVGRDFVCIEPFVGPPNAINTEGRLDVPPGRAKVLFLRIELA